MIKKYNELFSYDSVTYLCIVIIIIIILPLALNIITLGIDILY